MARLTIASVKRAAAKAGGRVEPDGCGGYDLLAPDGKRWVESETWCQPIPLGEADSPSERSDMLRMAMDCLAGGLETDQ